MPWPMTIDCRHNPEQQEADKWMWETWLRCHGSRIVPQTVNHWQVSLSLLSFPPSLPFCKMQMEHLWSMPQNWLWLCAYQPVASYAMKMIIQYSHWDVKRQCLWRTYCSASEKVPTIHYTAPSSALPTMRHCEFMPTYHVIHILSQYPLNSHSRCITWPLYFMRYTVHRHLSDNTNGHTIRLHLSSDIKRRYRCYGRPSLKVCEDIDMALAVGVLSGRFVVSCQPLEQKQKEGEESNTQMMGWGRWGGVGWGDAGKTENDRCQGKHPAAHYSSSGERLSSTIHQNS